MWTHIWPQIIQQNYTVSIMSYSVFIEFIQENSKYIGDFDQLKIKSQKLSISHLWCPVYYHHLFLSKAHLHK